MRPPTALSRRAPGTEGLAGSTGEEEHCAWSTRLQTGLKLWPDSVRPSALVDAEAKCGRHFIPLRCGILLPYETLNHQAQTFEILHLTCDGAKGTRTTGLL